MSLFYSVESRVYGSNGPIVHPTDWKSFLCAECRRKLPGKDPKPVTVELADRPRGIGGIAAGAHISVFHRRFIGQVAEHLGNRHIVGPVIRPNGTTWSDYCTCYPTKPVYERGSTPTDAVFQKIYRPHTCARCGWTRTIYAEPPRYLLARLLDDSPIFQRSSGGFFLADWLVEKMDWSMFPDAELEPILVLDRPLDDLRLPTDLDWGSLPPPPAESNVRRALIYRLEPFQIEDVFQPEQLSAARGWTKRVSGTVLCAECLRIRSEWYSKPIEAVLQQGPSRIQPVTQIRRTGIPVIHADLASILRDECPELIFGPCVLSDGTVVKEYQTCYAQRRATVRGGRKSRESHCNTCGSRRIRFDRAPRWILREDLEDAECWLDPNGAILLPGHIALKLDVGEWLGLRCWPLPVRDQAPTR